MQVAISLVEGNTAANGTFTITVTGANSFTLDGTTGNGAWTAGGIVTSPDALSLARALNAGIADVTAIATALGAGAPSLDPAHQAGTLADIATLTRIATALDVIARYKISGATLLLLAAAAPGPDNADAAMGAFQTQYPQNAWFAAVQPVEDDLRQARRDALVAYLLGPGPVTSPGASFLTTDDIFDYYLIDPEMCPCGETTRLLQPSLAIQQFVQQCFLNLSIGATVDTHRCALERMVVAAAIPAVAGQPGGVPLSRELSAAGIAPRRIVVLHRPWKAICGRRDCDRRRGRERPSRTICASWWRYRASSWRRITTRPGPTDRRCCMCSPARAARRRNGSTAPAPA